MPIWIVNILRQVILWVAKKYGKQILKKIVFATFRKLLREFIKENKDKLVKEHGRFRYKKFEEYPVERIFNYYKDEKFDTGRTPESKLSFDSSTSNPLGGNTSSTRINYNIKERNVPDYQAGGNFNITGKGILWP